MSTTFYMRRLFLAFVLTSCFSLNMFSQVKQYRLKVKNEYPHDVTSYTQGLFFNDGKLYESTGQYGESTFRLVDIGTGKPERRLNFGRKYFVEGSVALDDEIFILTWENRVLFVYDLKTLEYKSTRSYPRPGWGLTTDGKHLIASDGTSMLYFMGKDLGVVRTVDVKLHGRRLNYLNELEYIDGKIWANVYLKNIIVVIDPSSGNVDAVVDCTGLLPDSERTADTDVLNGIAYDESSGSIYLTGKNWPKMFEVELVEK